MSKFLSGRQSNLKLGVAGYTESKTVLETTGKVGIGTTDAQSYSLYVVGDTNITGVVSAAQFIGDGSNLANTGATLSAAAGTQRLVVTSLTSGTMVDAATDSDLTFNATTNTLNTDNLIVAGNLTVSGDQTILNTTQLEVEDINIGIASASTKLNDAQLDGAGITIYGLNGDKSLIWDNSNSWMAFNTDLYAPNLQVGTGVTVYGNAGIVSAISFYGDGSNLTNTGATLSATSGVERLVTTQLTSGTMVDAATDADLTFDAGNNLLHTPKIDVAGLSPDGTTFGTSGYVPVADGSGGWVWGSLQGASSVNTILNGFTVSEEGNVVGTAGSITQLDFRGVNILASADPQPNGIATISVLLNQSLDSLDVSGIATFRGPVSNGSTTGNVGQYLRSTGVGVTWASFPTLRVVGVNTAAAGQTTFNFSYNVDFLDVFVNGVKLTPSEYTATNGNQIVLNTPAFADEIVEFHSYNVASTYSGGGGGGGASNLNGLTDVTIGTLTDKDILQYQSSSGEWENVSLSSTGVVTSIITNTSDIVSLSDSNGVYTIDVAVGAGGTWATDFVGINTTKNVGIGTTAKDGYKLYVEGDARVTGILTVGPASVTIDGINNSITCTNVSIGGSVTATQLYGDASNVIGIVTTNIGKANVTISDNPPGIGTAHGDLWWESDTAKGHIYYNDGSSAQWVEFNPSSGGGGGGGGGISAVGIQSGGVLVGSASTINFVTTGSVSVSNDIATVSVGSSIRFVGARIYHDNYSPTSSGGWATVTNWDGTTIDTHSFVNASNGFTIPAGVSKVRITFGGKPSAGVSNQWTVNRNNQTIDVSDGGIFVEAESGGYSNGSVTGTTAVLSVTEGDTFILRHYVSSTTPTWDLFFEIEVIEGDILGDYFSGSSYTDANVDAHLNVSSASSGQILSWNGSDYAWVADQTGGGGSGITTANINADTINSGTLNVTGVSTFTADKVFFKNGGTPLPATLQIETGVAGVGNTIRSSNTLDLVTNGSAFKLELDTTNAIIAGGTGAAQYVQLYGTGSEKLKTIGTGVTVTGTTFSNQLNVSGISSIGGNIIVGQNPNTQGTGSIISAGSINLTGPNSTDLNSTYYPNIRLNKVGNSFRYDLEFHSNGYSSGDIGDFIFYKRVAQLGGGRTERMRLTGEDGNLTVTGSATATSFVKSGGTSSQYLMADGSVTTASGGSGIGNVVEDTTPQLGGDLDLNSNNISGSGTISATKIITSKWTLGANGSSDYTFTGPGLTGTVNDPTIYLIRGQSYQFANNSGGHPFRIQSTPNGSAGTQYNTGVTNNDAGNGVTLTFDVPFDAPDVLYYQCTAHPNMGGKIVITAPPKRFTTSASTGSIAAAATQDITIAGCETYALLKIATSHAAWVRLYTDTTSRTNDASRAYTTDPTPGSGVLAEVYSTTSGSNTFKMSPGVIGWNDDGTPSSNIYAKVTNNESGSANVTVTLTIVRMED